MWQFFWTNMDYTAFKIHILISPWQGPRLEDSPGQALTGFPSPMPPITLPIHNSWQNGGLDKVQSHLEITGRSNLVSFPGQFLHISVFPPGNSVHCLGTMKSHCNVSIRFCLQTKAWFHLLIVHVVLLM